MKHITRKNTTPIKVYCLPDERDAIKANAAATGNTASSYLLKVGIGYPIKSILDNTRVEELMKISGDLGRLGGLLKLWLTNDERTATFGEPTIRAVLSKISDSQDAIYEVARQVVLPKSKP
jgi:hypothetical protein